MISQTTHSFEKLGFSEVRLALAQLMHSPEARERILSLEPFSDQSKLLQEIDRTEELRSLLEEDVDFPAISFPSIGKALEKLNVEGNWLSLEELAKVADWLRGVASAVKFLKKQTESAPNLAGLIDRETPNPNLQKHLKKILDDRGQLRDDASPALKKIRQEMIQASDQLRGTLHKILRNANRQNWSIEKEITIRNDRLVIPVKAEAKGNIPGFVQDVSQTGGTVYVEPTAALSLNNRLRELQFEEKNEIIRILQEATNHLRNELPVLSAFREVMLQLEIIYGKARFALKTGAARPLIEPDGQTLRLIQAFYLPMLLKEGRKQESVIPLDLEMDHGRRIVVISGPNAGGKSVALKTVGLMQVMLQSGLLVPADPDSVFRLFDDLFVDIGDEQSVEDDLSTYTSHLYHWRLMGDKMGKNSLFLIDEFGSGTDPRQGGAIAESFLERFVRVGAYGIITTHYGNLKDFAEVTPGTMNAAMQFDTKGLQPTYRLIPGMPGRSYAFEMAERVGVHRTIIRKARKKVGEDEIDSEKLLKELERKNAEVSRKVAELRRREQKLDHLEQKTESLSTELASKRKALIREAKAEAREIIQRANADVERTIREIKEKQAEKKATRKAREKLRASMPDVPEVENSPSPKQSGGKKKQKAQATTPVVIRGEKPEAGDYVQLKDSQTWGKLEEIQGKRAIVLSGEIRLTVNLSQLQKIQPPQKSGKAKPAMTYRSGDISQTRFQIDVLGKRVEEALPEVDKFIDDARLAGLKEVQILHGKGSGVLRDAIRKHLHDLTFVKSTKDAPIELGGAGWTVVTLSD